jgi:hypothetical protein
VAGAWSWPCTLFSAKVNDEYKQIFTSPYVLMACTITFAFSLSPVVSRTFVVTFSFPLPMIYSYPKETRHTEGVWIQRAAENTYRLSTFVAMTLSTL